MYIDYSKYYYQLIDNKSLINIKNNKVYFKISDKIIKDFSEEENRFLSNFYPCNIEFFNGTIYPNSECAYQAQKCIDKKIKLLFTQISAGKAKKLGKAVNIRNDWDDIKVVTMFNILCNKFKQNPVLSKKLLETNYSYIQEGNYWKDCFWGVDMKTGEGKNILGILLMCIRYLIKENII